MGKQDRTIGLFSSIHSKHDRVNNFNHFDIKPEITKHETNTYFHDIDIYTNSSKTRILSLSGSNNQGLMLNDAQFNMTNIFDRPIIFYLNQYSLLFYIILLIFLIVIFTIILAFIYYQQYQRKLKQQKISLHHQQKQQQSMNYCCKSTSIHQNIKNKKPNLSLIMNVMKNKKDYVYKQQQQQQQNEDKIIEEECQKVFQTT